MPRSNDCLYPKGRFAVPGFRPNTVVKPTDGSSGFTENLWLGRTVAIGDRAAVPNKMVGMIVLH